MTWYTAMINQDARVRRRKGHPVIPVYMASGYNWCRECGKNIRPRGDGWVHTGAPFDSYRKSTNRY